MHDSGHVTQLLDSYSLGCLDPGEARMVARHLRSCAACRSELHRWEGVAARLAYAAPPRLPPRELESRLLALHRFEQGAAARGEAARGIGVVGRIGQALLQPAVAPAAMAASMVLALGLGVLAYRLLWNPPAPSWATLAAGSVQVSLQATTAEPAAHGTILFRPSQDAGLLTVSGLPRPPQGRAYQLWMYRADELMDGGMFSVDTRGMAVKTISAPYPLSQCRLFKVTLEPTAGSTAPTGVELLSGTFQP